MKTIIKNFLFKKRFKIMKNNKGFSLMELLVAVGIIGTLVGIGSAGIPNTYKAIYPQMQKVRPEASQNTLKSIISRLSNLLLTAGGCSRDQLCDCHPDVNEKITGAIEAKDAKYKAENQWLS